MAGSILVSAGRSRFGAIAGIALIASGLLIGVALAIAASMPWLAVGVAISFAVIGAWLIVTHLSLGHRGQRRHEKSTFN